MTRLIMWSEIIFSVPQGLVLWSLLFKIFLCHMFYFLEDFNYENYVDFNHANYTKSKNK